MTDHDSSPEQPLTTKQLEGRVGETIAAKVQIVVDGQILYRRIDGVWERYPDE